MGPEREAGGRNLILSESDARELDRLLRKLQAGAVKKDNRNRGAATPEASSEIAAPVRYCLVERARAALAERNRRVKFLSKAMFGEPAWDMLLHLYVENGKSLTLGRLVSLIGEPKTTVLRWAAYLEEKQLIVRREDSNDRRLALIELSERGQGILDEYFRSSPPVP